MSAYNITRTDDILKLAFGTPAQNDQIVRDAVARLAEMEANGELAGGGVIKLNGPASLPVSVAITHALAHRFAAVAVFDPKMNGYVVSVSHDPSFVVGSIIPA